MVCTASLLACGDDDGPTNPESPDGGAADTGSAVTAAKTIQSCAPERAASAYRATTAGSTLLPALPPEAGNPVPCLSLTGHGANEPGVGVARDGTVYFAPATGKDGNGILSSKDEGVTWTKAVPKFPDGSGHSRLQPFFYLDPKTDKLFFAASKLVLDNGIQNFKDVAGINLTVSDDGGKTWRYQSVAPNSRDWQKIFAGKAVSSNTGSYPNILYMSAPSPIAGNWAGIYPAPDFQYFYKSINGGESWTEVSKIPLNTKTVPGCIAGDYIMFSQGVVTPDGTVVLGYRLCQQLAIVVSKDEGSTWQTHVIPDAKLPPYDTSNLLGILGIVGGENAITGQPIAVDAAGNLYAVWIDPNNALFFSSSKDLGVTWTKPVSAMAPGVTTVKMVTITAKEAGKVAFSYFGSKDGTRFDGYIAESANGTELEPTFWTTTVNDPAAPLYPEGWQSGYDITYFNNGGDEITLLQIVYAPNGDLWASFVKDMCPNAITTACSWDYAATGNSRFQGAAGRLKH